jgi:hypothetical protein
VTEPLDDELGEFVGAFKQVERPTPAARAATWAAIDARLAEGDAPRRLTWPVLAAIAAAVALCVGAAAVIARGARTAGDVAASHHAGSPSPAPVEPPRTGPPAPRVESVAPRIEPERPAPAPRSTPTIIKKSERRPRPASAPSLRPEEVASFRRAQAALAEERAADALQALDDHGRRFPGGLFEEERQISRAAALCLLGREADARAARDRFLRAHPGSHLTERARSICREIE